MSKIKLMNGVLKMRFDDIYGRFQTGSLTTEEAGLMLGVSVRTFKRYRDRYEETGGVESFDRRLGRTSPHRSSDDEVKRWTQLYADRYKGFSVKHFHEWAQEKHGLTYGYTWTKRQLENAGLVKRSKKGGDHRLRRPRRPQAGMMLHQDASTHLWIEALGHNVDLIITMDDANSVITSAFFVPQEGTESSLHGIKDTIEGYGLFCSFYTDRGSHYAYTPDAGGKVDKHRLTQVGQALKRLGIQHIAAYSPQARGRSERMFGTLQGRLPKEITLEGITTMEEANRYLKETYIPRHNRQFSVETESPESAYTPWTNGDLNEVLCVTEERQVKNDNTVHYNTIILQIPETQWRHHYVKTTVVVKEYLDKTLGVFYGHQCLGRYHPNGTAIIQESKPIKTLAYGSCGKPLQGFPQSPQAHQPQKGI